MLRFATNNSYSAVGDRPPQCPKRKSGIVSGPSTLDDGKKHHKGADSKKVKVVLKSYDPSFSSQRRKSSRPKQRQKQRPPTPQGKTLRYHRQKKKSADPLAVRQLEVHFARNPTSLRRLNRVHTRRQEQRKQNNLKAIENADDDDDTNNELARFAARLRRFGRPRRQKVPRKNTTKSYYASRYLERIQATTDTATTTTKGSSSSSSSKTQTPTDCFQFVRPVVNTPTGCRVAVVGGVPLDGIPEEDPRDVYLESTPYTTTVSAVALENPTELSFRSGSSSDAVIFHHGLPEYGQAFPNCPLYCC